SDHRHVRVSEKLLRGFLRAPVARERGEFADSETLDEWLCGLFIGIVRAVVADLGIGENDDLTGVGRIGEDFLIAGDGGIKNDFAGALGGRANTLALEDAAVFQGEQCGSRFYQILQSGGQYYLTTGGGELPAGVEGIEERFVRH